ncbi:hypothetical protein AAG906_037976 [Vitis piasezkii]
MPKTPQSKGLMYVEALVNGKATKALWTQCHSQLCLEDEARRLEFKHPRKEDGSRRQFSRQAITWSSSWVTMHIGSWEGRVDFTVAPMDDFKMVLGMDFLKVKVVPLPFLRSMTILEEENHAWSPRSPKTPKTPMLSAMQVKRG